MPAKTPYYRLDIAPLTILPLSRSPFFTYFSRTPVLPGALVSVPFGKQTLRGVVSTCQKFPTKPAPWIKEIHSVLQENFVTQKQLALAESISERYFTPLGKTLTHFVPEATQSLVKTAPKEKTPHARIRPSLKKSLLPLLQPGRHILSIAQSERDEAIACLIKARLKSKQSILVVVPEILGAELLSHSLTHFGIPHEFLTSAVTNKAYFSAWQKARLTGSVIIGTRQALFAPFTDLGTILLLDPLDDAYKQWDMSPRYDARHVVRLLADTFAADLISLSPGMSVTERKELTENTGVSLDLTLTLPLAPLELVNLRLERYRKNSSPLSETARTRISHALARQEKIAIIVNQSGYSKITLCEACKNIFRCPKCQAPLHPGKSGNYTCSACNFQTPLFPHCPTCGHLGFRQIGFGTERVEREVRKSFAHARITRIDKTTLETRAGRASLVDQRLSSETDILIGVPSLLNHLADSALTTILFVDTDTFLIWSDFRTDERFLERVLRARLLAGASGIVLLETFQPESAFFRKIASDPYLKIIDTIVEDRSSLLYPPFAELAAIEIIRDSKSAADQTAQKLGAAVKTLPESEKWRIFIQQAPERRFRGKYIARILIRTKKSDFSAALTDWLRSLPKDTFIDRDPISLHV